MNRIALLLALAVALALTACQPAPTRQTLEPTQAGTAQPEGYPAPVQALPTGYPAGASPALQPVNELWMAYPPAPADEALERGNFLVEAASLTALTNAPGSYDLSIEGSLPNGCHVQRVMVNPPDPQNVVHVQAYTVVDPAMACAEMIVPFAGQVATIAGLPSGTYQVLVNGEVSAGEMIVP